MISEGLHLLGLLKMLKVKYDDPEVSIVLIRIIDIGCIEVISC